MTDRLSARPAHFAGEGWAEYLVSPLIQTLPWTPLIVAGAWGSFARAIRDRGGPDRLLWAWAAVPAVLVSMATVRNGHYLIHALPPLSIWAALALDRLGSRLRDRRGWSDRRLLRGSVVLFGGLGIVWAAGFLIIGPKLNTRDAEFAFYEEVGRLVAPGEPLVLLYDLERDGRWDKEPYPTPFGPVPADLAARLYSLDRPAMWRRGIDDLKARMPRTGSFAVIGRDRDLPEMSRFGRAEVVGRGPATRWDRHYVLMRVEVVNSSSSAPAKARRR